MIFASRLHHLTLRAVADDTRDAIAVLRAAESAIPRALASVAAMTDDEVLVLRRVDLRFGVNLDGHEMLEDAIERAVTGAVRARIERARSAEPYPIITETIAWFPNEPTAIASHLAAIAEGRASTFPYRLFMAWGATWTDVLHGCLARGRVLTGSVLAHVARSLGASSLARHTPLDVALAIIGAWTRESLGNSTDLPSGVGPATPDSPKLIAIDLPADVLVSIRRAAEIGAETSIEHARLLALVELFERWPPARDLDVPLDELRILATPPITPTHDEPLPEHHHASRSDITSSERRLSTAGGLLAWSMLFEEEGITDAIEGAYPDVRARCAALWALGRAAEDAGVDGSDPLLLLWSGEDPTTGIEPTSVLRTADPEPLHRLAIDIARQRGWLGGALEIAQVGDLAVVTGEQICVDAIAAKNVHDAVPDIVIRFSQRVGAAPSSLHVEERISDDALAVLLEVDAPVVPEAWRPAVRALVSVARRLLMIRAPDARMSDIRRWPAIVELTEPIVVEISRSHMTRMVGGTRLDSGALLGMVRVEVRAK